MILVVSKSCRIPSKNCCWRGLAKAAMTLVHNRGHRASFSRVMLGSRGHWRRKERSPLQGTCHAVFLCALGESRVFAARFTVTRKRASLPIADSVPEVLFYLASPCDSFECFLWPLESTLPGFWSDLEVFRNERNYSPQPTAHVNGG